MLSETWREHVTTQECEFKGYTDRLTDGYVFTNGEFQMLVPFMSIVWRNWAGKIEEQK